MKIYIQVVKGSKYELEVNEHTSIEEARDLLIKNYEDDFKNNLPSRSNNSINITYNFIYNGKYLFDPDPFSTLKENSRVILYIKKSRARGLVRLEILDESENEVDEEESGPIGVQQEEVRQFIIRAANNSLISQVYNPRNNFWDHSLELSQIENIMQGDGSQGAHYISSNFMREHYRQLFRYNDINIGTILNVLGGGPLLTFGNEQNLNNEDSNENDNDNDRNDNNINNSYSDFERNLFNNRIYSDNSNTSNFVSELDILIMEMPTTSKEAYNDLLRRIESNSELKEISKQVGPLKIAQIFKENGYDIDKAINSIQSINQESKQNDNANTSNNDN